MMYCSFIFQQGCCLMMNCCSISRKADGDLLFHFQEGCCLMMNCCSISVQEGCCLMMNCCSISMTCCSISRKVMI